VYLLRRVKRHLDTLKTRREKGRRIRDRDPFKAYDEKEEAFMDALAVPGVDDDRYSRNRIETTAHALKAAYADLANHVCSEADAERITGLYSASMTDDADPLVVIEQFEEAINVVKAAKADRETYDALLLDHGGFFRSHGGFVFLTGEQVRAKRESYRDYYARSKEPGFVPFNAAVATLEGHNAAFVDKLHNKQIRRGKKRARIEAALDDAGLTAPPDCDAVIHEGELKFVVKHHLAKDVDMDNPPSSREDAIELAALFRMLLDRPTLAEFRAETPGKFVYQVKDQRSSVLGKWEACMPWPMKRKPYATRRLINPTTMTTYFDTEQEAIDRKYAWYEAEKPEDWLKKPEK